MNTNEIYRQLGISQKVLDFCQEIVEGLRPRFNRIDQVAE